VQSVDSGLLNTLSIHANEVLSKIPREGNTVYKVKKELLSTIPLRIRMDEVASNMNMGERTLQRRLKSEGTTFKHILSEIRLKLARKMLLENEAISDVAYLLGFSEPSAFIRAFKSWTQNTPKQFQLNQLGIN